MLVKAVTNDPVALEALLEKTGNKFDNFEIEDILAVYDDAEGRYKTFRFGEQKNYRYIVIIFPHKKDSLASFVATGAGTLIRTYAVREVGEGKFDAFLLHGLDSRKMVGLTTALLKRLSEIVVAENSGIFLENVEEMEAVFEEFRNKAKASLANKLQKELGEIYNKDNK